MTDDSSRTPAQQERRDKVVRCCMLLLMLTWRLADSRMVDMVGRRSWPSRPTSCSMTGERLTLPLLARRRSA